MALYDYAGALRRGRRQYQASVSKGEYPYLPVLDQILSNTDIVSEVNLGIMDIPLEKVAGTKTEGRTTAFANNFMPLLTEKSEFGAKWAYLYDHQIEEGIHDPITAYEFMNQYYVQEGNKRVSVLKYVGAFSISASVTRLIPKRTDDLANKLYYEFLDFYQVSFNCDLWFSKEGGYEKLLKAMNKNPGEIWDEDTRTYFKAAYDRFSKAFHAFGGDDLDMTCSDAFLIYVDLFGYPAVRDKAEGEIKKDLSKLRDELSLADRGNKIALVEQPEEENSDSTPLKLINWLLPSSSALPEMLKLAFISTKNPEASSWTYGHELGRMHLEQAFDGKLKTLALFNADSESETENAIEKALKAKCNMIFTTASQMINPAVKAAIEHPEVKVFNCSVNMSYSSVSTYYGRMYESKFLMGALAASMAKQDKLGYIADYPIYGTLANVNAFALGARMINPCAKVYLEWSKVRDRDARLEIEKEGISFISGDDFVTPQTASREYGLYRKNEDGSLKNLATPIWHWGKFYERIVRLTCNGAFGKKDLKGKQAINYWWGMSADVIDVICSQSLPSGTGRLMALLKNSIRGGSFQPFEGTIYAQDGTLKCREGRHLSPEEITTMNWLTDNVIGQLPEFSGLTEEARLLVGLQGQTIYGNAGDGGQGV